MRMSAAEFQRLYGNPPLQRQVQSPKPKRLARHESLAKAQAKAGYSTRYVVIVTSRRRRLLDEDNLIEKYHLDSLRYAGLLPSDAPEICEIKVKQEKVLKKEDEETIIEVTIPQPMQTPSQCSLITDPSRPRVSPESAAIILQCVLHGEPKKLNLSYTSGIQGREGDEFVEFSADGYRMAAFVRDKSVTNLFLAITPKNSEYHISDGGNVFSHLSIKEQQQLTEMLIGPHSGKDRGVELVPAWIIAINGARPYATGLYYDEDDGKKALVEQRSHFEFYQQKLKDAPPEPTKVKAPPIAFSKRMKKGKK